MSLFDLFEDTEQRKRIAWQRTKPMLFGQIAIGQRGTFAHDELGNIICWEDYGDTESPYGWEIDHVMPSALGGSDHHSNLRALSCQANRALGGILSGLLKK